MNTPSVTKPSVEQQYVNSVAEILLESVGTVTTLGVKESLREIGFWALQAPISEMMEVWAKNTGRVWNDVRVKTGHNTWDTFRVYRDPDTPGKAPHSIHQQDPIEVKRKIDIGLATIVFK